MFCYAQDARLEKNTKSGATQELQNISKQWFQTLLALYDSVWFIEQIWEGFLAAAGRLKTSWQSSPEGKLCCVLIGWLDDWNITG